MIDCTAMIEKTYQPADIEGRIAKAWEELGDDDRARLAGQKARVLWGDGPK